MRKSGKINLYYKHPSSSLYVHIPFCSHLCSYCDFPKLIDNGSFSKPYLAKLKEEILSYDIPKPLETIYIGGGTPTSLSEEDLEDLFAFLSAYRDEKTEFTLEANPESFSLEKMKIASKYGVNRISIGVQSSHQSRLDYLGRKHTFEQAKECINQLKKCGFSNINADLMYGFSNGSLQEVEEDITAFLSLDIPHISTYSFILEKMTKFYLQKEKEGEEDEVASEYELILKKLRAYGYERYEVSNFAKPGYESRHNLVYWHDEDYYGCGLGASGYLVDARYTNTKSLSQYLKGKFKASEEKIAPEDDVEYFLLTNLRLKDGFEDDTFFYRFGFSFLASYHETIQKQIKDGLLTIKGKQIAPTDKGILLLDRLLVDYFR